MTFCLPRLASLLSLLALTLSACAAAMADAPRALPAGKLPNDVRLSPPKDLDGYFPFTPPTNREAWEKRAERVKRQMLVSQGLWPLPEKTPLNPVVHGLMDQGDFTIEKVYFESFPGFHVTGSLYRPKKVSGKVPGVLFAHGHWADGRFHDKGLPAVRQELVQGAERFEDSGRNHLQSLAVQAARMGCICFQYDMIGYADSQQISFDIAHRFAKQRPEMNKTENWGLFSTQAEAHLQSVMGLQSWNSIRALDFLASLPEVDASRIAITGASGGGTQSFMLAALDQRIALSFPAVMVSTAMQGGCTCENASCLRVDTGNIEFAALFAPKPQGVTAADDWTKEMSTKGFPELKAHYAFMGAPNNVALFNFTHFGHNYNYVSRAAFFNFVNKQFKMGLPEPVVEEDYKRLDRSQLTVYDAAHPRPEGGAEFETKLLRTWTNDAEAQLKKLTPTIKQETLEPWKKLVGGGIDAIIGRGLPAAGDVEWIQTEEVEKGDATRYVGLLRNKARSEEVPALFFLPKTWNKKVVIWITDKGKAGLLNADGGANGDVAELLKAGTAVCGVDLIYQGEFLADGKAPEKTPKVGNSREFAGYTLGYNHSVFEQRVHDILTAISFCQNYKDKPEEISLVGLAGAGHWVAAARAQAGEGTIEKTVVDTNGFRFGNLTDYRNPDFLPGGAKYGDLPGIISLTAPDKLMVLGETKETGAYIVATYKAAWKPKNLTFFAGKPEEKNGAVVAYLLAK
ncbi:MAG: acetylxylan esterase [Pirellulaceae bacterium]